MKFAYRMGQAKIDRNIMKIALHRAVCKFFNGIKMAKQMTSMFLTPNFVVAKM